MSPLEKKLGKEIVESDLSKEIKEGDQLFVIGRNFYINPQVEKSPYGFRMYGTPIDPELPLFSIEVDFGRKKVSAEIKGCPIPIECKDKISDILKKYF